MLLRVRLSVDLRQKASLLLLDWNSYNSVLGHIVEHAIDDVLLRDVSKVSIDLSHNIAVNEVIDTNGAHFMLQQCASARETREAWQ